MFSQIFMAIVAVFLFYIGVVDRSIINILVGLVLLTIVIGRFYAAKTGSSFQAEFTKWRTKQNKG
jgi:hypothetical protein